MSVTIEGLDGLISAFRAAPDHLRSEAKKVVAKGALNIKNDARQRVWGGLSHPTHLPHYAASIDYDLTDGGLTAEVGPNMGLIQGAFGRGVEFGSSGTGPIPHMIPAFDTEDPKFLEALRQAAIGAL